MYATLKMQLTMAERFPTRRKRSVLRIYFSLETISSRPSASVQETSTN